MAYFRLVDCSFDGVNFKVYTEWDGDFMHRFYYGRPFEEEGDLKLFKALTPSAKTVVDIEANTGLFTILANGFNYLRSPSAPPPQFYQL